jgi:hypothetical protein
MPMPASRLPLRHFMACSYSWPRRVLPIVACAVLIGNTACAADPVVNGMTPYGVQRGKEATLTFNGAGLANVKEILFYTPGLTVKSLEAKDDTSLKAVVAVAPECELGIHAIRMRSTTGVSNLRTFTVRSTSRRSKKEPNNGADQPQAVPLNVTVRGVVRRKMRTSPSN